MTPRATAKPTAKDREILGYLKCYPHLSSIQVQQMANTVDHRDCMYRLRKAGNVIDAWRVYYVASDGKNKWYNCYKLIKAA